MKWSEVVSGSAVGFRNLTLALVLGLPLANRAAAATLSGTVTGPGGAAVEDVSVWAYRYNGDWYDQETHADVEASGNYTLAGLPAGTYRILFWSGYGTYAAEWYNDQYVEDDATDITLTASQSLSGINAQLALGTRITGTVTDSSGSPLEDITVMPHFWQNGQWRQLYGTSTDENGQYEISTIPAGTYLVVFEDWRNKDYAPQWYSNALEQADARRITAPAGGMVSGINAVMAQAGSISGRLTAADGSTPVPDTSVSAFWQSDGSWAGWGETDENGDYMIGGLAAGTYIIQFYPPWPLESQWYHGAIDSQNATPVPVGTGQHVTGIDDLLGGGVGISGSVTDPGGAPLEGVWVSVLRGPDYDSTVKTVATDSQGDFQTGSLANGDYKLRFWTSGGHYRSEWWNNKTEGDADIITMDGEEVASINAVLERATRIAGTVTDAGGMPLHPISVIISRWNGENLEFNQSGWTDTDGTYSFGDLIGGAYTVQFLDYYDGNYLEQYYNGAANEESAERLLLDDGEWRDGVNAVMADAPFNGIAGTLSEENSGTPIANAYAQAYAFDGAEWQLVRAAPSNGDGFYQIRPLPPGTYRVRFFDDWNRFPPECYNNAATIDDADDIIVEDGVLTTGIDAELTLVDSGGGEDTNDNGIPDQWELDNFGTLGWISDTSDWDEDGFPDDYEFRAGTCPTNAVDFLGIVPAGPPPPAGSFPVIQWKSADGKFYSLARASSLAEGFSTVFSNIAGSSPFTTVTDTTAVVDGPLFYRILLEE